MMPEARQRTLPLARSAASLLWSKWGRMVLAVLCVGLTLRFFLGMMLSKGDDSWAPMIAALDFLQSPGPHDLFGTVFFDWGIKFQYPPSSLLFLQPIYDLGIRSRAFFNGANFLFMIANAVVCALLACRLFGSSATSEQKQVIGSIVFLASMAYAPISYGFSYGQIQIGLNFLFSLSCLLMFSGKPIGSGILIAIATAVKPQFGPLLLIVLLQKHWRFALGFAVTAGLLMGISVLLYGFYNHLAYLDVLRFLSERGESYYLNASINGIVNRFLNNGSAFGLVQTRGITHSVIPPYNEVVFLLTKVGMVFFMILPFLLPRRARDPLTELLYFGNAAVCFVMASPVAWNHHYGILMPIYLFALKAVLEAPGNGTRLLGSGVLLVSFMLTGGRFPRSESWSGWETLLLAPIFFGSCLLVGLLCLLIIERSRAAAPARS